MNLMGSTVIHRLFDDAQRGREGKRQVSPNRWRM